MKEKTLCLCSKNLQTCDKNCQWDMKIDTDVNYHRDRIDCTCYVCNQKETEDFQNQKRQQENALQFYKQR